MAGIGFATAEHLWEQPFRVTVRGQFFDEIADHGVLGARERLLSGLVALGIASASLLLWGVIIAPFIRL